MADQDLIPSKLLALFLRPDFWLWLGLLAALWTGWRGWRKTTHWIIVSLVVAVTMVGFVPVGTLWLTPLERQFPPGPALPNTPAAIVILGGAEDARISNAWNAANTNAAGDRFLHVLTRAQMFPQTPVLFTGGAFNPLRDAALSGGAQLVHEMLSAAGLDEERIHVADGARTTAEHPEDVAALLQALDIQPTASAPLLLITSAYHMPRAMGVFCVAGFTHIVADPTDHRTAPGARWRDLVGWNYAANLTQLQLAFREWVALVAYARAGHTFTTLPGTCNGT